MHWALESGFVNVVAADVHRHDGLAIDIKNYAEIPFNDCRMDWSPEYR